VTGLALFVLICVAAVIGYVAAGWKIDDAVYMVVITIFGVGYGEVNPIESSELRALTITVIVAGYAAVIYTVGGFMQMVVDGELNKALGARRMNREIERLLDHTIVCGFGRMGSILARELHAAGKPFVVIDTDPRRLQEAEERGYLVIDGDASEEYVLERAGIRRAGVLAAMLSQDATNVFVTITARELNPRLVILARGENPRTERKLLSSGADKVVLPMAIGAAKVAQLIIRPSAESLLENLQQQAALADDLGQIGLKFDELVVQPASSLAGRPLREIEVRSNHGLLIVGVRRAGGAVDLNPPAELVLAEGDAVIVLGHADDLPQLAGKFSGPKEVLTYRGASLETY